MKKVRAGRIKTESGSNQNLNSNTKPDQDESGSDLSTFPDQALDLLDQVRSGSSSDQI